jgi:hypothetical protein
MAYEVILDQPQVSGVVGLDVAQNQPVLPAMSATTAGSLEKSGTGRTKPEGKETLEHAALTVAVTLGILWFFGATILKDARL